MYKASIAYQACRYADRWDAKHGGRYLTHAQCRDIEAFCLPMLPIEPGPPRVLAGPHGTTITVGDTFFPDYIRVRGGPPRRPLGEGGGPMLPQWYGRIPEGAETMDVGAMLHGGVSLLP